MRSDLIRSGYHYDEQALIWIRSDYKGITYSDGDNVERRIASIVNKVTDLSVLSDELRPHCIDWPSLYHLSGTRANILRPFESDLRADVLEIGAGCGAITRYLAECGGNVLALEGSPRRAGIARARTRDLENVFVVSDNFNYFEFDKKFDLVTLIGVLEYANLFSAGESPALSMLKRARSFLKPNGKLIIAIENQLGLKYFSGAPEDHLGIPMYGIEGRYRNDQPQTYGRKKIEGLITKAGFKSKEFLVPFPDYKLPVSIITERGFSCNLFDASALAIESVSRDPQLPSILAFSPDLVWPTIVENGLALDLANSFLIVASAEEGNGFNNGGALAWSFTTERSRELCKLAKFVLIDSNQIKVNYKRLGQSSINPVVGKLLINHLPDPVEYRLGISLSRVIFHAVSRDGWRPEEVCRHLRDWLEFIVALPEAREYVTDFTSFSCRLPGAFFDLIPKNIIVAGDRSFYVIDTEWIFDEDLEIGYLVFRALWSLLHSSKRFGRPADEVVTFYDLVESVMTGMGWSVVQDDIARWIELEYQVQSEVVGRDLCSTNVVDWLKNTVIPVTGLVDALGERNHQIVTINRELTDRDNQIAVLNQAVADRDGQILKRDSEIHWLKQSLASKGQQLEAVYKSLSWRITALPRFALRTWQYRGLNPNDRQFLGRLFRRACSSVMRFGRPRKVLHELVMPSRHGLSEQASGLDDILVWGVIDWHFRIQRPQHLARELAATGRRVFYFTCNFAGIGHPGFSVERLDDSGRLYQVALHLPHRTSIYALPPSHDELRQLAKGLGLFLEWSDSRRVINVIQHAFWLEVATKLPNSRLVYDCMDHHEGFGGVPEAMIALERRLAERADMVVVSSQWLDEVIANINPKRVIVRNACQYVHFCQTPSQRFQDTAGRQIIGYYGAIAEWFDLELVATVAEKHPNCLILLVGADTCGAQAVLSKHANVQFTGEVPYAALPGYLYAFDVCMLPFHVVPLTQATNPVKVYEYLSAGKPVVAVDLPEMRQFGDLIRVAGSHSEFVAHIGMGLSTPFDEEEVKRRQRFAAEQTWVHRARQMMEAIQALPEPKVSVVVVTYNNLELTKACLHSLEQHSLYSNLEIIVVDNASADESPAFLRDWVAGSEGRHLILNADNKGFAAANNQGLALATGDYLVLLNNDTVVTPGWVRTLLNHLRQDPSIGIIGPVTNNIGNEARIEIQYDTMDSMQAAAAAYTRAHLGEVFSIRTLAFFCVMLPRSTYEKVGPLDEAFGRGFFEDDDYCRRVEQLGLRSVCAEDVFVHHHLSASFSKLKDEERKILFEHNKAVYEAKWGRWVPHSYRSDA